jgi:hypothetical protein
MFFNLSNSCFKILNFFSRLFIFSHYYIFHFHYYILSYFCFFVFLFYFIFFLVDAYFVAHRKILHQKSKKNFEFWVGLYIFRYCNVVQIDKCILF